MNNIPKERMLIIKHYNKGVKLRSIGKMLDIHHTKAHYWVKRYQKYGINGLETKKQKGKTPLLSKGDLARLKNFLVNNKSLKYNGKSNGWTSREVKKYVLTKFNVNYTLRHIERILHKIGFSLITSRTRNIKASQEKQEAFKQGFKKNSRKDIWDCQ